MSDLHTNPTDRPVAARAPHTDHGASDHGATDHGATEHRDAHHRDEFTLRIPKPGGGGPARSALRTTEFWMTIAIVFLLLLAGFIDADAFPRVEAWRFATWAVMAYVISRGLAKLGNRADAAHEREH